MDQRQWKLDAREAWDKLHKVIGGDQNLNTGMKEHLWDYWERAWELSMQKYSVPQWTSNLNKALNAIDAVDSIFGVAGIQNYEVQKVIDECKIALNAMRDQVYEINQKAGSPETK